MLFIINFFITFLLLEVTARLTKRRAQTLRLVLASVLGGVYSFILLVPHLAAPVSVLSKAAASVLILLAAFRFYRVKSFFHALMIFLFTNFIFLGVIVGCILLLHAERIKVNNGVPYFAIGARGLLLCAAAAYAVSLLIIRLYNRRTATRELFWVTVEKDGKSASFFAFADTGNRLREPFSDAPVMVVSCEKLKRLSVHEGKRIIPARTIGGAGYYEAFRPDSVVIKTAGGEEVVDNVYIALSEHLTADDYAAVFNPEILSV